MKEVFRSLDSSVPSDNDWNLVTFGYKKRLQR